MNEFVALAKELLCWPTSALQAGAMKLGAATGLVLGAVWNDTGSSMNALIALIIIDYATGIIAAVKAKALSSGTGFKGLGKKFAMLGVVFLAWLIDEGMKTPVLCSMAIMMYSANEGLSILENLDRCGWGQYIPAFLKDKIEQIKAKKTEAAENENIHQPRTRQETRPRRGE